MRALFMRKAIQQPIGQSGFDWDGGHGHVRPRADGLRARCGGAGVCPACIAEASDLGLTSEPAQGYEMTGDERGPIAGDTVKFVGREHPVQAIIREINGSRVLVSYGTEDFNGEWMEWPTSNVEREAATGAWVMKAMPGLRGRRAPRRMLLVSAG